jgi:putative ABC transport system permease protein
VNLIRHLARLLGRDGGHRGTEVLDDVLELYADRRRERGWAYAVARAAWDIASLSLRPSAPKPAVEFPNRSKTMARTADDVRHAVRAIARRPMVSLTIIATLALGLGLSILTFTFVDGILLRPLHFPRGEELVSIFTEFRPESGYTFERSAASAPEVADYARQNRSVDVAAWQSASVALAQSDGVPEPIAAVRVSANVFNVLETPPALGRTLAAADDRPGAPCVVVLSNGLWRDTFGGTDAVVGRLITLSGQSCEVVGVMPRQFAFPTEAVRLWLQLPLESDPNTRGNHGLFGVGRMRPGVSLDEARQDVRTLMAAWAREHAHHKGHGIILLPLKDLVVGPVSAQLQVLAYAVGLVLIVIAANVSSMMVAHGEARRKELAVRAALGASRGALVRQLVMEAVLLAAIGGAVGTAIAAASFDLLVAWYPGTLPRASEVHLDVRVVAAALLGSLAIGVVVALLPAIRLTRLHMSDALKSGERGEGLSLNLRTQACLVTTELAIAVAVVLGALLLARSFIALQQVPLGFDAARVTTTVVSLPLGIDRPREEAPVIFANLTERLRALPGVEAVGAMSHVPLRATPPPDDFTIEGRPVPPPGLPGFNAHYVMVTPDAFEALRVRIIRGRAINQGDVAGALPIAVINEAAARTFWPDANPVGQRIRYAAGVANGQWSSWGPWLTIVGIVDDVRYTSPGVPALPAIYVSHAQLPRAAYDGRSMALVIRTSGAGADLASSVRTILMSVANGASMSSVRTMDATVGAALARPRFMGWIMTVFAVVSLAVAALGVYGMVAYGVARRTREIGVRMALGASRQRIVWTIGRQTLLMVGAGLIAGLAGAAWLSRSMQALLFGVSPLDLGSYGIVTGILLVTVLLAVVIPARRALSVDPLVALRVD